jgi:hypothetical protein
VAAQVLVQALAPVRVKALVLVSLAKGQQAPVRPGGWPQDRCPLAR